MSQLFLSLSTAFGAIVLGATYLAGAAIVWGATRPNPDANYPYWAKALRVGMAASSWAAIAAGLTIAAFVGLFFGAIAPAWDWCEDHGALWADWVVTNVAPD